MGASLPRMGSSCTPCSERPHRSDRSIAIGGLPPEKGRHSPTATSSSAVSRQGSSRATLCKKEERQLEKKEHEGQFRATLHVKDGGFALRNFERKNPGKVEDFFKFETKLGEGGFGTVQRGQDKRTDRWHAVKCVRKRGGKDDHRLQEEIEIMRVLDHPHIVRLVESFEDHKYCHLVLELCEGGELLEQIIQARFFTEATAAKYIKQMLLAVNYLHQNHIMHRDLKPENWLLATKEGLGKSPLKLIDFGISRRFKPGVPARTKAGTPNYVAPEVLSGRYDEKADIWSLGVITYVLLTGTHPFLGKTTKEVMQKVKQGNVSIEGGNWRKISDAAKSFVRSSLQKSPALRHSALKALGDRWLGATKECGDALAHLELTGLQNFGRMHQLKKAACTVIATQLTDERIEALRSQFMAMDHNKDGTLSVKEAGVACPDDLDRLLKEADTDGSGVVDYTEFLAATMDKKLYHQESTVWMAFKKFDLNGSGSIDRHELSKVLSDDSVKKAMHLQEEAHRQQLEEIFSQVDTNQDGVIDFDEFFAMMCHVEGGNMAGALRDPRQCKARGTLNVGIASPDSRLLEAEPEPERPLIRKGRSRCRSPDAGKSHKPGRRGSEDGTGQRTSERGPGPRMRSNSAPDGAKFDIGSSVDKRSKGGKGSESG